MERNYIQNHPNREVDEDHLDLTLRLGVGDSRTTPECPLNQQNSELGSPVMAGEHYNPLPNERSGSSSSNTVPLNPMAVDQTVFDTRGYDEMPLQRTEHLEFPENNADDDMEYADPDELDNHADDMELDIDDMTYENLLEVEEQIGTVSTGLSKDTIDERLVRYFFPLIDFRPRACCICQEYFTDGEMIGFLECMHDDFHFRCIKNWLLQKNECPLCRCIAIPI